MVDYDEIMEIDSKVEQSSLGSCYYFHDFVVVMLLITADNELVSA